jgi:WD40 repeat protein/flagellar motor protein MotB
MKSSHVSSRFLALITLSVMVLILAPTWAELTPEQFGQQVKTAVQNNDLQKTPQLTAENPQTAYGLQPELEPSAARTTGSQADRARTYAQQIRDAPAKTEEERTAQQSRTQQKAPTLVTAKEMIQDPSRIRITVNFATNQADILPQYRAQLDELGKAFQQMAGLSFEIGGHTDQRGPEDHNMRLSERRSESVRRYLIDRFGIASNRLIARGYGESTPLDPRDTPEAWDQNRRVEVVSLGSYKAEPLLTIDSGGHQGDVFKILFTSDNRYMVSAGNKEIRVWHLASGRTERRMLGSKGPGREGEIRDIALSPDGTILAVGGIFAPVGGDVNKVLHAGINMGVIRLYDFANGTMVGVLKGHTSPVNALAFSPDGRLLASLALDLSIRLWDLKQRRTLQVLGDNENVVNIAQGTTARVAFSPDGQRLASISTPWLRDKDKNAPNPVGLLQLWSVGTGAKLGEGGVDKTVALALAWDPQDRFVATMHADGTIRLWDSHTATIDRPLATEESFPTRLALSPDGKKLLMGSALPPFHVYVYSVPDGHKLLTFAEHASEINNVAIAPDGRTVVTIGADGNDILLWDITTGQVRQRLETVGRAIFALGVSHDGRDVGFGFHNPCPEQVMCPEKLGALTQTLALRNAQGDWHLASSSLSPDQVRFDHARLVYGPYRIQGPQFDLKDAKQIDAKRMSQEDKMPVLRLYKDNQVVGSTMSLTGFKAYTFTADGRYVAAADFAGVINVFRVPDMQQVATLSGHNGSIDAVAVSSDSRYLFSGGFDQALRIWHLADLPPVDFNSVDEETVERVKKMIALSGQEVTSEIALMAMRKTNMRAHKVPEVSPLVTIFPSQDGEWVAWTQSGYYAASPQGDRYIGWHMNRGLDRAADWYGADQFAATFYRPDVVAKTLELGSEEAAFKALERPQTWHSPVDVVKHAPPTVRILAPQDRIRLDAAEFPLRFELLKQNDDPLSEVTILVNGRAVRKAEGLTRVKADAQELEPRKITHELAVPLVPGRNLVRVVAATRYARSNPIGITVERQTALAQQAGPRADALKPRLFILAVGVSRYANPRYNLNFAHQDAREFAGFFTAQQRRLFSEVHTRVLLDEQATRGHILEGLDWLGGMAQNDMAIIFLAGHGQTSDDNQFYFLGHDSDFEKLRRTGIKWTEFRDTLQALPGKVILMADACHAGAATRENKRRDGSSVWDPERLARAFVGLDIGVVVFMASMGREFSVENAAWGHGAFTKALLDGLRGAADSDADHMLHFLELASYVSRAVPKLTNNNQHPTMHAPETVPDYPIAVLK